MQPIKSAKRVVCPHGNTMSMEFITEQTENGWHTTVKQEICKACTRDLAEHLAAERAAVLLKFS